MRILDKYILRNFLGTLIFSLIAFCTIFIIVDLIGYLDNFIDRNVPYLIIIKYYVYYLPYIIVLSFPVAMLLGSLFSIGQMTRYNEIVAMTSSGISLFRILLPLFLFGIFISGFILYVGERVIPTTNERKLDIYKEYVSKSSKSAKARHTDMYLQIDNNQWMNIGFFDAEINTAHKVTVLNFDDNFQTIHQRLDAPKMVWINSRWELYNGISRHFTEKGEEIEKFDLRELPKVDFSPEDLSKAQKKAEEMDYWELRKFIENIRRNGGNPDRWLVDLYLRISFPFANFIILLFGAPLASRKTRSGPAVSFGISLFICFLYFGIIKIGQTFGHNGTLSPFLAAWIGNILFGIAAVLILFKMRK